MLDSKQTDEKELIVDLVLSPTLANQLDRKGNEWMCIGKEGLQGNAIKNNNLKEINIYKTFFEEIESENWLLVGISVWKARKGKSKKKNF